jgi:hypothetical protein
VSQNPEYAKANFPAVSALSFLLSFALYTRTRESAEMPPQKKNDVCEKFAWGSGVTVSCRVTQYHLAVEKFKYIHKAHTVKISFLFQ